MEQILYRVGQPLRFKEQVDMTKTVTTWYYRDRTLVFHNSILTSFRIEGVNK